MFFFLDFIYLFMRDTEREAEREAEGEAGSMQGARRGTWSQDPGITTWTKDRCSTTETPGCPLSLFINVISTWWIFQENSLIFRPGTIEAEGTLCRGESSVHVRNRGRALSKMSLVPAMSLMDREHREEVGTHSELVSTGHSWRHSEKDLRN